MNNTTRKGPDWAQEWISTDTEADDLAAHTILLVVEGKRARSGGEEVGVGGGGEIEAAVAQEKVDGLQVKGLGIAATVGVFTWPK